MALLLALAVVPAIAPRCGSGWRCSSCAPWRRPRSPCASIQGRRGAPPRLLRPARLAHQRRRPRVLRRAAALQRVLPPADARGRARRGLRVRCGRRADTCGTPDAYVRDRPPRRRGWPATLLSDGRDLLRGAVILAAALLLLAGSRTDARRTLLHAVVLGAALVAVALGATTQPAVAKTQFLHWETWDLYTKPPKSVGVRYVWNSNYAGFRFPRKVTTVFKVKAPPPLGVLARDDARFVHGLPLGRGLGARGARAVRRQERPHVQRPAVRAGARDPKHWRRASVEIQGLADDHLVAPSIPVAYGTGFGAVGYARGGIGIVAGGLHRGEQYDVWSYSPQPTPAQLARSTPAYPPQITRYRRAHARASGACVRRREPASGDRGPCWRRPRTVVLRRFPSAVREGARGGGRARSPYGAAVALESWFRQSGGFTYTQRPPRTANRRTSARRLRLRTKQGYCQHYAGAMALMLRYLGVPARVAAGFSSGTYDGGSGTWTVTDHDAHAWVEVWFRVTGGCRSIRRRAAVR